MFMEIKVGVAYKLNVEITLHPSANQEVLVKLKFNIRLPGWNKDVSNTKTFKELSVNAQNYV